MLVITDKDPIRRNHKNGSNHKYLLKIVNQVDILTRRKKWRSLIVVFQVNLNQKQKYLRDLKHNNMENLKIFDLPLLMEKPKKVLRHGYYI